MYEYKCSIIDVYDGDTVKVEMHMGLGINFKGFNGRGMGVRVNGIDTPEIRTRNLREKKFGYMARDRMRELLPVGSKQIIQTLDPQPDKYGRFLANFVLSDGKYAADVLIEEKLGVAYYGQNKRDIEDEHLANWSSLEAQGA